MAAARKPPTLPETIRIGHVYYEVIHDDEFDVELNNRDLLGLSHGDLARVAVRSDLTWQIKAETLLHEVLHQCLHVSGVAHDVENDLEERIVRAMAKVLIGVIHDNPEFVKILTFKE